MAEAVFCLLQIIYSWLMLGFLMERGPPLYFEKCIVPQTVEHLVGECPSLGDCHSHCLSQCQNEAGNYCLKLVLGVGVCHPGGGFKRVGLLPNLVVRYL